MSFNWQQIFVLWNFKKITIFNMTEWEMNQRSLDNVIMLMACDIKGFGSWNNRLQVFTSQFVVMERKIIIYCVTSDAWTSTAFYMTSILTNLNKMQKSWPSCEFSTKLAFSNIEHVCWCCMLYVWEALNWLKSEIDAVESLAVNKFAVVDDTNIKWFTLTAICDDYIK